MTESAEWLPPITTLQAGESYASIARIRDVADLPEMPITVDSWQEDGKRCVVVVRALSNVEKRDILAKTVKEPNKEALHVALYALKEPKLSQEHLEMLDGKNPAAIELIARTSHWLSDYRADAIIAAVKSIAGVSEAAD